MRSGRFVLYDLFLVCGVLVWGCRILYAFTVNIQTDLATHVLHAKSRIRGFDDPLLGKPAG